MTSFVFWRNNTVLYCTIKCQFNRLDSVFYESYPSSCLRMYCAISSFSDKCMIKIFWVGGRGGDTFKTPSLPMNNSLPLPTPYFKMFLKRSLNDPHPPPPHFKHLSLLPPPHPPTLPPPKNFDHTLSKSIRNFLVLAKKVSMSIPSIPSIQ